MQHVRVFLILSLVFALSLAAIYLMNLRFALFSGSAYADTASFSAWEWDVENLKRTDLDTYFQELKHHRINKIYVDIGSWIDAIESPDQDDEKNEKDFIRGFISIASNHSVEVVALAGTKEWFKDSHSYLIPLAIEIVNTYNSQVSTEEKLGGIQFDIEPHGLDDFQENEQEYLVSFIQVIRDTINYSNQTIRDPSQFEIGFALPYWFDGSNGNITKSTFNNEKKFATFHIIDLLNSYPNSAIYMMSYRNYVEGKNGVLEIVDQEKEYISTTNSQVNMYVGLEFNNEEPEVITFYNKDEAYIWSQLEKIDSSMKDFPNYRGMIMHEVNSFTKSIK